MLRLAAPSDIAGMQRVRQAVRENRLVSLVVADEDVRRAILDSGRGWVVEVQGEVVAFAVGNATTGNIWALFVHPDHEGRGHGRRLLDAMISWLWSRGLARLWLSTDAGSRAERFYESAGWRRAGTTASGEIQFELQRPASVTGARGSREAP